MEIKNRIWDDLKKQLLEPGTFSITDNGISTIISVHDMQGMQYDNRYVVEPYTNRKDKDGTEIYLGDKMAPIVELNLHYESVVEWCHGSWFLVCPTGISVPLYDINESQLDVKDHILYGNKDKHICNEFIPQYNNLVANSRKFSSLALVNEKAFIYKQIGCYFNFGNMTETGKFGASVVWWSTLTEEEQRAYKFDFGLLRSDEPSNTEVKALYTHYIIDGEPMEQYKPN